MMAESIFAAFPRIPADTISKIVEEYGTIPAFDGNNFKNAPQFLLHTSIVKDYTFNELFPGVAGTIIGAKNQGIIFAVVNGQVIIEKNSKPGPMIMKIAEEMLPYLKIILSRRVLKVKTAKVVKQDMIKLPVAESECWCVENNVVQERADTPHRCGYLDGFMGVTMMIDDQLEHHPAPCQHGSKCYNKKKCLYSH